MAETGAVAGATILPFVRRPQAASRLSAVERLVAVRWAAAARHHGVRAMHIHDPEPGDDPSIGSFLLIYSGDAVWASWGVSTAGTGYELWRPGSGVTVGWFRSLRDALEVIVRAA